MATDSFAAVAEVPVEVVVEALGYPKELWLSGDDHPADVQPHTA